MKTSEEVTGERNRANYYRDHDIVCSDSSPPNRFTAPITMRTNETRKDGE